MRINQVNTLIFWILLTFADCGMGSPDSLENLPQEYLFFDHYGQFLNFETVLACLLNSSHQLTENCQSSLLEIKEGVKEESLWALKLKDSWGRVPEGILSGHLAMLGDFDECILNNLPGEGYGKYCLVTLEPTLPMGAKPRPSNEYPAWGMCFPSECTKGDVSAALTNFVQEYTNGTTHGKIEFCYTAYDETWDFWDYFMIGVILLLLILGFLATAVDMLMVSRLRTPLLLKFSVRSNLQNWAGTSRRGGRLECLNGLRCLFNSWIVLKHLIHYGYTSGYIWNANVLDDALWNHQTFLDVLMSGGACGVDTFFVIGACLISYKLVQDLNLKSGQFKPLALLLHRYIRLTPLYIFTIGIYATIIPHLGSGPLWNTVELRRTGCREQAWDHILYVSNFLDRDSPCLGNSWYLAVDMQFYLLAPSLVYLMWKWRMVGISILTLLVGCSWAITIATCYAKGITTSEPIGMRVNPEIIMEPWYRFPPYGIGLLCGRFLAEKPNKWISRRVSILGWICSTVLALGVLFGPWQAGILVPEPMDLSFAEAILTGSGRTLWAVSIAWIIFACANNYGWWVNEFLSHSVFTILAPLTYGIYLFNTLPEIGLSSSKQPIYYDAFEVGIQFFGYLVLMYGISIVCHLLVELPIVGTLNYLIDTIKRILRTRSGYNQLQRGNHTLSQVQ